MSHIAAYAQWTGFTVWLLAAWALLGKLADLTIRLGTERRRHRNARRLASWQPPPRHAGDPGSGMTRVPPPMQPPPEGEPMP